MYLLFLLFALSCIHSFLFSSEYVTSVANFPIANAQTNTPSFLKDEIIVSSDCEYLSDWRIYDEKDDESPEKYICFEPKTRLSKIAFRISIEDSKPRALELFFTSKNKNGFQEKFSLLIEKIEKLCSESILRLIEEYELPSGYYEKSYRIDTETSNEIEEIVEYFYRKDWIPYKVIKTIADRASFDLHKIELIKKLKELEKSSKQSKKENATLKQLLLEQSQSEPATKKQKLS